VNLKNLHRVAKGGFTVQYTDDARGQIGAMEEDTRDSLTAIVKEIAAKDPYAYGPPSLNPDTRTVDVHGHTVTYLISRDLRLMTVIGVKEA
jgi:hypothetical protein